MRIYFFFFFQAEDGIRDYKVTGVQTCALPIYRFFELNESFHMQLLQIADNRWRNQLVADLRKVMKLNRHKSLFKQGRIEDSLAEHETVMQALLRRDGAAAAQRSEEHTSELQSPC